MRAVNILKKVFPFATWFKGYKGNSFKYDFIAGITVALILIPQSMAYAQLAGLPPHYGLYASFLPPMVAALFGSSRQLATGPVAVVSLMTAACLAPLATAGSTEYVAYAVILSFSVGVFQFSLGFFRLGLLVNFLSHPVVNGFSNGAAIIIATSQLSKLFGVSVDSAENHFQTIFRVLQAAIHFTHWPSVAMGIAAFAIMYGLKRLNPQIPYVLVAVVTTTVASWLLGFSQDSKIGLDKVDSAEAQNLIREFNEATSFLDDLSEQRVAAMTNLENVENEKEHNR